MQNLVKTIAQALVDEPEQIEIAIKESESTSMIELSVAKADIGKIIGKSGNTAKAIRTILNAASKKHNKRILFEILE